MNLQHKFVEYIPEIVEPGVIYISIKYCTAIHKCVCGCGNEVITPISPTDWKLQFDGETISLTPSIGNWSFQCKSHYWITRNEIRFARRWSNEEIEKAQEKDIKVKKKYFSKKNKN